MQVQKDVKFTLTHTVWNCDAIKCDHDFYGKINIFSREINAN